MEWAKIQSDNNVIFSVLAWAEEQSRAGIEALFAAAPESARARYGSADEYVLSLFNHQGPMDARHTLTSYRVLTENIAGDEAVLTMEYHYRDGFVATAPQRYVRIGDGWHQALDFDAPSQAKMSVGLQREGEIASGAAVGK